MVVYVVLKLSTHVTVHDVYCTENVVRMVVYVALKLSTHIAVQVSTVLRL